MTDTTTQTGVLCACGKPIKPCPEPAANPEWCRGYIHLDLAQLHPCRDGSGLARPAGNGPP